MNMKKEKERGTLLTIWLILMLISNLLAVLGNLFLSSNQASFYPNTSSGIFYILSLLGLINIGSVIYLFKWKKWGFYAFCGVAVIAFIINLIIGLGVASLFGFIGVIILYLLLKPKWDLLE